MMHWKNMAGRSVLDVEAVDTLTSNYVESAETMSNGWVKFHRTFTDSDLWMAEPFTKGQAFVDLFLNANHKSKSFWVRGIEIKVERGQIAWSEVTMANRWRWSRNKVRRFLKFLEKDGKTKQQTIQRTTTVITLVNYDKYQTDDTTNETTERQQKDNKRYTNKNVKNVKNDKNIYIAINSITESVCSEIAEQYNVSLTDVKKTLESLRLYCESNGKKYKNYKSALQNWIRRNIETGKTKTITRFKKIDLPETDYDMTERIRKLKREHGLI